MLELNETDLDSYWRSFFASTQCQILLSSGALMTIGNIISLLAINKIIDPMDASRSTGILKQSAHADLTETTRPLFWKFVPSSPYQELGDCRLGRLLALCEEKLLNDGDATGAIAQVRHYRAKLSELDKLLMSLKHCRNVAAHELNPRVDFGWCLFVPSTVLRVIEVCDFPMGSENQIQALREQCIHLIDATLHQQALSEEVPLDDYAGDHDNSEYQDIVNQESVTNFLLGKMEEFLKYERLRPSGAGLGSDLSHSEVTDSNSEHERDDEGEGDFIGSVDTISSEILRQRLLEMKKNIDEIFSETNGWPGPEANILQRAIVNDVIVHRPRSKEDWIRMPDASWRYQKHKPFMESQFLRFWPDIEVLLKKTVWPAD